MCTGERNFLCVGVVACGGRELKRVREGEVCLPHFCQFVGSEVTATAWAEVKGQTLARVQTQGLWSSSWFPDSSEDEVLHWQEPSFIDLPGLQHKSWCSHWKEQRCRVETGFGRGVFRDLYMPSHLHQQCAEGELSPQLTVLGPKLYSQWAATARLGSRLSVSSSQSRLLERSVTYQCLGG